MRVTVHVALLLEEPAIALEEANEGAVRLEHLQAHDRIECGAAEGLEELRALVNTHHDRNAVLGVDLLVVLTVGGRLVHNARTIAR